MSSQDGVVHVRNVQPGVTDNGVTQVDGIDPGEIVADSSFDKLQDNAKVMSQARPAAELRRRLGGGHSSGRPGRTPPARATRPMPAIRPTAITRPSRTRVARPARDHEPISSIYPAAGRDFAADGRDLPGRARSPSRSSRSPRCRRSITPPSR